LVLVIVGFSVTLARSGNICPAWHASVRSETPGAIAFGRVLALTLWRTAAYLSAASEQAHDLGFTHDLA
jgi:hypothetical protein